MQDQEKNIWLKGFELAKQIQKAKIWDELFEEDLLAIVSNVDGQTYHLQVMGQGGEYEAIHIYPGKEGLRYRLMMYEYASMMGNSFFPSMIMFEEDGFKMTISEKDDLTDAEKQLHKDLGLKMGKSPIQFLRAERGYYSTPVDVEHMPLLNDIMETLLLFYKENKKKDFMSATEQEEDVLLLIKRNGDTIEVAAEAVPETDTSFWPDITLPTLTQRSIEKLPKKAEGIIDLLGFALPVEDEASGRVVMQGVLVCAAPSEEDEMEIVNQLLLPYTELQDALPGFLAESLTTIGYLPEGVSVNDPIMAFALNRLFDILGINLYRTDEESLMDFMAGFEDLLDNELEE